MNKVVRDGKVAIIYHPGFGVGWYSDDCYIKELLFDSKLVEIITHPNFKNMRYPGSKEYDKDLESKVNEYFNDVNNRNYIIPSGFCKGNVYKIFNKENIYKLDICWIPVGKKFIVTNYDGKETIYTEDDMITA